MAALIKRPVNVTKMQTLLGLRCVAEYKPWAVIGNSFCQQPKFTDVREHSPNTLFGSQNRASSAARGVGCRQMSTRSGEFIDFKLMDHHEYKFRFMFRPFKFLTSVSRALVVMSKAGTQFNMAEFLIGSKQAIMHVSQTLAPGNFKDLEDLVNPETLEKIKPNYRRLPEKHKELIAVKKDEDFISLFVYEMRTQYLSDEKKHRVEADVVAAYKPDGPYQSLFKNPLFKAVDTTSAFMCNYTFVKFFPDRIQPFEDKDDGWTIDKLNHFKIMSLMYEMDKGDIPPKQED